MNHIHTVFYDISGFSDLWTKDLETIMIGVREKIGENYLMSSDLSTENWKTGHTKNEGIRSNGEMVGGGSADGEVWPRTNSQFFNIGQKIFWRNPERFNERNTRRPQRPIQRKRGWIILWLPDMQKPSILYWTYREIESESKVDRLPLFKLLWKTEL